MNDTNEPALPASLRMRDPDEPLPHGYELPKNMVQFKRNLKHGGHTLRILYRVPQDLRQAREVDGKKKLLSWKFPWTFGGLLAAIDKQQSQEPHLRRAKAEACRKESRFYVPTCCRARWLMGEQAA